MNKDKQDLKSIAVIGAGIVGTASALTLQREGYQVVLIDKNDPARETSFGNAGLLATSTLVPMNNPSFWGQIPEIISRRSLYVKYDFSYLVANSIPLSRFILHATDKSCNQRALALKSLIYPSINIHKRWLSEAGELNRLRDSGWLKLYTSDKSFHQSAYERRVLDKNSVDIQLLDAAIINELEPHLSDIYRHGLWVRDSQSVDNPAAVCEAYVKLFIEAGGQFIKAEVNNLTSNGENQWHINIGQGDALKTNQVVLCAGPWMKDLLKKLKIPVPMIYERGGHRLFENPGDRPVSRPILDAEGGFVISPMEGKYRMTCGVHLSNHNQPYDWKQLNTSEQMARERFPLGEAVKDSEDWTGTRPAFPDYLPMIGHTPRTGLWVNTGHHHIGLTMAPASAQLLADMMASRVDHRVSDFSPLRYM